MECMERFKRSKMCGTWWWIIWKSSNFVDLHSVSKVFKALRRLPKRLKTLELRSGDTHKIQMFLKCFWLLRKPSDQKNIFIDERFDYIWIFMSTKIWRFSCTFAKISLWSVWRDLKKQLGGELYENLQIFVDLHSVQKFLRRYGAF